MGDAYTTFQFRQAYLKRGPRNDRTRRFCGEWYLLRDIWSGAWAEFADVIDDMEYCPRRNSWAVDRLRGM